MCRAIPHNGDLLHLRVVPPPFLRVGRWEHQRVRDDLAISCNDEGRLHPHLPQAAALVGGETALLVLDLRERRCRPRIAAARLPAAVLLPGYQFGRPVIAAACDPVEPLGERGCVRGAHP